VRFLEALLLMGSFFVGDDWDVLAFVKKVKFFSNDENQ
jgi:hypothetical protein